MPSREYLQAILDKAKASLSAEDFAALHRAALPSAGGRATWSGASLSQLEQVALRELRPAMLHSAEDSELSSLWNRLAQWHKRAIRKKQDAAMIEQAAGHLLQEMKIRKLEASGPLVDRAYAKSTLADRLEELPDAIQLARNVVSIVKAADGVAVDVEDVEAWYGDRTLEVLDDIGVTAAKAWLAQAAEREPLYDLALVRSGAMQKSTDQLEPPEWLVKAQHNGAMVAIMAPAEARMQLANVGLLGEDAPDDLHITLLYLGEAATLSPLMLNAIAQQVAAVCSEHMPIRLKMTGLGRFEKAVFGLVTGVGLSQLQADLERAVGSVIRLPSEHGWVPHMTLGTVQGDAVLPDIEDLELPAWAAEHVRIQVRDAGWFEAPLLGGTPGEVAAWEKMIRHEPGQEKPWALYTRDGSRLLGRHATEAEAEAQERTILDQQGTTKAVKVLCSEPAKQIIYYLVSEPGTVDAHGHKIDRVEVEDALHGYMAGDRKMKLEHGQVGKLAPFGGVNSLDGRAMVVEGYIAPADLATFHGQQPPDGPILEGSSIVGVHYTDRALWEKLSKEEHGISWGGFAQRSEQ